ncbi:MAG: hypothetical protein AMXMBFR23_14710 [Chloroflexota bacterium]
MRAPSRGKGRRSAKCAVFNVTGRTAFDDIAEQWAIRLGKAERLAEKEESGDDHHERNGAHDRHTSPRLQRSRSPLTMP